tara:strand:- start:872 stop:1066 length:195 start_codon:yes stop_codon:yes gene_type:complete
MSENLDISIRKFLKEVGVTSQKAIENAWAEAFDSNLVEGTKVEAKMVLTIDDLKLVHTVTGEIG